MKICILVNDFGPPWVDGIKNSSKHLAQYLVRHHEVLCIGLSGDRKTFKWQDCQVELVKSPFYNSPLRKIFLFFGVLALLFQIRKIFSDLRPDVVLSNSETASMSVIGWLICQWIGSQPKHVQIIYGDVYVPRCAPIKSWLTEYLPHWIFNNRFLARIGLKLTDRNIAVSRYLVSRMEGLGARNVDYVPIGVDSETFRPNLEARARYPEEFVIGYLGHLTYVKGASLVLDAFRYLRRTMDVRLLLSVTTGSERELLSELTTDEKVTLSGPSDAAEFFASCDIYVLPRRASHGTGNLPNTVLEAMACGTVVVTSAQPGVDEVVHDGKTGYLVKSNDLNDLVSKLKYLAEHEDERRATGIAGRKLVMDQYTWSQMTRKVEEILCG